MSVEADTTVHAHLVVILNERLLSAAESGDIPKLQVLRCVLGPIRALAAKWPTLAAGVAATWRRCRASRPVRLDRPGSRLRRTFRSCNLRPGRAPPSNLRKASVTHKFEPVLIMHWNE